MFLDEAGNALLYLISFNNSVLVLVMSLEMNQILLYLFLMQFDIVFLKSEYHRASPVYFYTLYSFMFQLGEELFVFFLVLFWKEGVQN